MNQFRNKLFERVVCLFLTVTMGVGIMIAPILPLRVVASAAATESEVHTELPESEAETVLLEPEIQENLPNSGAEPDLMESDGKAEFPKSEIEVTLPAPEVQAEQPGPEAILPETSDSSEQDSNQVQVNNNDTQGIDAASVTHINDVILPELDKIHVGMLVSGAEYREKTENFDVKCIWQEGQKVLSPEASFKENGRYTLVLTLIPKPGFQFSAETTVKEEMDELDASGNRTSSIVPRDQIALNENSELVITFSNIIPAVSNAEETENNGEVAAPSKAISESGSEIATPEKEEAGSGSEIATPEKEGTGSGSEIAAPNVEETESCSDTSVPAEETTEEIAAVTVLGWEWVDIWECLQDGETGKYAELLNVRPDTPATFERILACCLPESIIAVVDGQSENPDSSSTEILLSGWQSPDYISDENGNYPQSGIYSFTAQLPENYILGEGVPALQLKVRLPEDEVQLLPEIQEYGLNDSLTGLLDDLAGGLTGGIGGITVGPNGLIGNVIDSIMPDPGYSPNRVKEFDVNFYAFINNERTLLCHNGPWYTYNFDTRDPSYVYREDLAALYAILGVTVDQLIQDSSYFPYTARGEVQYSAASIVPVKRYFYSPYTAAGASPQTATDIYYVPNGVDANGNNINSQNNPQNNFYSVSVYGGGQDGMHLVSGDTGKVLDTEDGLITLSNTDSTTGKALTWRCIAQDGTERQGTVAGDKTVFDFSGIEQYYNIRPLENAETDINFYAYVDGKRQLVARSSELEFFKGYCWNWVKEPAYTSAADLKEIYGNFIAGSSDKVFANPKGANFPFTKRTLNEDGTEAADGAIKLATVKDSEEKFFTYTEKNEEVTNPALPTNVYYFPAGATENENLSDISGTPFEPGDNNFWSVRIEGLQQNQECYIQHGQSRTIEVPGKPEEWVCVSKDGTREIAGIQQKNPEGNSGEGDYVSFTIENCDQPYIIHPTKFENGDIDFYAIVDDEPMLLSHNHGENFGVYNWRYPENGENYVKGSDLDAIYGNFGSQGFHSSSLTVNSPSPFAFADRGSAELSVGNVIERPMDGATDKFSPYTDGKKLHTVPSDIYYMPKGLDTDPSVNTGGGIMSRKDVQKNTFYSVNVYEKDETGSLVRSKVSYFLYGSTDGSVTVPGKEADKWICVGDDGTNIAGELNSTDGTVTFKFNEANLPTDNSQNKPAGIKQPYTIIKEDNIPGTLNVDFYIFADRQRVHIKNADVPVVKVKDGNKTYLYLTAETLERYFGDYGFQAAKYTPEEMKKLGEGKLIDFNTIFYSSRDRNLIKSDKLTENPEKPGTYMTYVSKTGNPVDVFYVPLGERYTDTWSYETLMESSVKGYNGFYRIRVADPDGKVYTPSELALVPDVNFVQSRESISVTVSNRPKDEEATGKVQWEVRDVENTRRVGNIPGITITENPNHTTIFTFDTALLEDNPPPYLIIPASKPLSRKTLETTANFYVALNGEYLEVANRRVEQVFIPASDLPGNMITDGTVNDQDLKDRYYIPAETLEAVFYDYGFRENLLGEGKRILFAHDASGGGSHVYKAPLYKDPQDGKIYVPVLIDGDEVTVYYLANGTYNISNGSPSHSISSNIVDEECFYTIRRLDPSHLCYDSDWYQYQPSSQRGKNSIDTEVTPVEFVFKSTDKQGNQITWDFSPKKEEGNPEVSFTYNEDGTCTVKLTSIKQNYDFYPVTEVPEGHYRIIYDTVGDLVYPPENMANLPSINGQTRYIVDVPLSSPAHTLLAPLPSKFIFEDKSDKGMIESEFTGWYNYDRKIGEGEHKPGTMFEPKAGFENGKTFHLTAQWKNHDKSLSDSNRVNFFVGLAALPAGSKEPPTTYESDYTSSVFVSRCNVKTAWNGKTHQQIAGHSGSTNYDEDHADVMHLLTGKIVNQKLYKIDSFPSDEEVFTVLRRRGSVIKLNGERIPLEKLTTEFFTIKWFSFKDDHDGWHLDGRIMAKTGELVVTKRFTYPGSDAAAKAAAEAIKSQGFHIDIELDPSAGEANKHAVHSKKCLRLPEDTTAESLDIKGTWNDEGTICTWRVPIDSFAQYVLREENYIPNPQNHPGITTTTWYNLYNAMYEHENVTTWNRYPTTGIKFTGRGVQPGGGLLTIDLDNNYMEKKLLSITKYDAATGHHLGNITFDVYKEDATESVGAVTTDSNGYAYLEIKEPGTYIFREHATATDGGPALGYLNPGDILVEIEQVAGAENEFQITSAKCTAAETEGNPLYGKRDIVSFTPGTLDLNIRNYSRTMKIKIEKIWENVDRAEDVVIQLYRDGAPMVGNEFIHKFRKAEFERDPNSPETKQEFIFEKPVPVTVDGEPARYTVVETAIGNTKYSGDYADGYQYYNVHYDPIKYFKNTDFTEQGDENFDGRDAGSAVLTTRNSVARRGRYIMKSTAGTGKPLAGVEFLVYADNFGGKTPEVTRDSLGNVEIKDATPIKKLTTDDDGYLDFAVLGDPYDQNGNIVVSRYYMVEHKAPDGFEDNLRLYYFVLEGQSLSLFSEMTAGGVWQPIADRDIVNYPEKPKVDCVDFTIVKKLAGNMFDASKEFNFKIEYTEGSPGEQVHMTHDVTLTKDASCTIHDVSMGEKIIITELDPGNYSPSVEVKKIYPDGTSEDVVPTAQMQNGSYVIEVDVPNHGNLRKGTRFEVTVTNTLQAEPDTGITLESLPYVLILLLVAAGAIGIIVRRRRKHYDDNE